MAHRRKFSAEYKREAVAMLDAPGVSVGQIAAVSLPPRNTNGSWPRIRSPVA